MSEAVITAAANVSKSVISSLPAQFLLLCILNLVFIIGLLVFLDRQRSTNQAVYLPIISRCLEEVPIDVLKLVIDEENR